MKTFLNFKNILVFSPHPDDIEYSASGTILKYPDTSFTIINMTEGGDFDKTTFNDYRTKEVENFWKGVSNVKVIYTDAVHMKSKTEDEWVNYIETKLDINSFDIIMTTNQIDSHFEHRQTSRIAEAVCRVSKVGIIEYFSPSTLVTWNPNLFVDIADQYEDKLAKLKNFKSQNQRSYFKPNQIRGFHTNFQASKRGLEIVEMFNLKQLYV